MLSRSTSSFTRSYIISSTHSIPHNIKYYNKYRYQPLSTTTKTSIVTQNLLNDGLKIDVKAYYIARGIEIMKVPDILYPSARRELEQKSVTIFVNPALHQYITVFSYGSVILFNIPEQDHISHLRQLKKVTIFPIAELVQHIESYKVVVNQNLELSSILHADHIKLRKINVHNITIISMILSHSVILDYYSAQNDKMIDSFTKMNNLVLESGNFNLVKEKELYKLVASNSTINTNVLSKVGLFEGTDAAWEKAEYSMMLDGLRKEFELDSRYQDLSLKVNIINEDARYFLSVIHHRKSTTLEWMIIVLITGEMLIGICSLALQLYKSNSDDDDDSGDRRRRSRNSSGSRRRKDEDVHDE